MVVEAAVVGVVEALKFVRLRHRGSIAGAWHYIHVDLSRMLSASSRIRTFVRCTLMHISALFSPFRHIPYGHRSATISVLSYISLPLLSVYTYIYIYI